MNAADGWTERDCRNSKRSAPHVVMEVIACSVGGYLRSEVAEVTR